MNDFDIQAALAGFWVEAGEMMAEMESLLLALESRPDDPEQLNALFRTVHTVKGTAGLFGLRDIVEFTHEVETVLDQRRDGQIAASPALSSLLLACKDHVQALLVLGAGGVEMDEALREQGAGLVRALASHQVRARPAVELPAAVAEQALQATAATRWRIAARFGAGTFQDGFDPLSTLGYLSGLGEVESLQTTVHAAPDFAALDPECCHLGFEIVLRTEVPREEIDAAFMFVLDSCELQIEALAAARSGPAAAGDAASTAGGAQAGPPEAADPAEPAALAAARGHAPRSEDARIVRVPADKLDQLINLVGELVIAASGTGAIARRHRLKDLQANALQLGGLIESIRDRALSLRMVAIGETFNRFRRVVRDLSAQLGKEVELELLGSDAELDKSVVERLGDPLVHIVRNALDHGIEQPARRVAAGKPARARLTLSAQHEAGGVVIRVADDGAGLNHERILAKAVSRGLVAPDARLDEDEIAELVFAPGFSTAESVTDLSGRGVGMDVVRRAIEELRGTVTLRSQAGRGTTVEMRLPLTLAIIDGFHVRVGEHQFVLPMGEVVECINTRQLPSQPPGAYTGHLPLRGTALPVLYLRELFELEGPRGDPQSIVVVRSGTQKVGLVTDTLIGEGQTVIKPMGELFERLEGVAGATVLGTGEVALILDVPALVALATRAEQQRTRVPDLAPG